MCLTHLWSCKGKNLVSSFFLYGNGAMLFVSPPCSQLDVQNSVMSPLLFVTTVNVNA